MNVLVCVKRVPQTGGRIVLTADGQAIDTKFLGFAISPHEECGVEEAVRIVERAAELAHALAYGAGRVGQPRGTQHEQGDDAYHEQLERSDMEHAMESRPG